MRNIILTITAILLTYLPAGGRTKWKVVSTRQDATLQEMDTCFSPTRCKKLVDQLYTISRQKPDEKVLLWRAVMANSTTDTALVSFTALDDVVRYVPVKEWTNYEFELPEGAKYFAVRCISHDRQAMMVDDFGYEECAHPLEVTFVGYNVYRNGEKINSEVLTSPEYETTFTDGDEFYVEVVYDLGKSDPSNTVRLTATGISSVDAYHGEDNSPVYDIAGRKVSPSTRGLHIKRGKKYVVD